MKKKKKKKLLIKKIPKSNLKVMSIFSNTFIFKNNNNSDILLKLKETENKYNQLKKEKERNPTLF